MKKKNTELVTGDVIRCKDCDCAENAGLGVWCLLHGITMKLDDYCSYGEKAMNDYKELCENPQCGWGYVDELRDAIKQLVKERDAAVADLKFVSDKHDDCSRCKHENGIFCNHSEYAECSCENSKWEWRGTKNER